jgi:hypothetical protein
VKKSLHWLEFDSRRQSRVHKTPLALILEGHGKVTGPGKFG